MSKRLKAYLLLGVFSVSIFSGCAKKSGYLSKISAGDVQSIVISKGETVQDIYDKGTDDKKIQELVDLYNAAKPTTSQVTKTAEDIRVKIELKDKKEIYLKGGEDKAESVSYNGKNFNITSDSLAGYFDELSTKYSK